MTLVFRITDVIWITICSNLSIYITSEPIEILAGMCYGGIWGTIFITISSFIISSIVVFAVRKLGRKFVYDFVMRQSKENSK